MRYEATGENHTNLVADSLVSKEELQAYYKLMNDYSRNRKAVFTSTTVQQIVAYK